MAARGVEAKDKTLLFFGHDGTRLFIGCAALDTPAPAALGTGITELAQARGMNFYFRAADGSFRVLGFTREGRPALTVLAADGKPAEAPLPDAAISFSEKAVAAGPRPCWVFEAAVALKDLGLAPIPAEAVPFTVIRHDRITMKSEDTSIDKEGDTVWTGMKNEPLKPENLGELQLRP
jgi:hypothetical protein